MYLDPVTLVRQPHPSNVQHALDASMDAPTVEAVYEEADGLIAKLGACSDQLQHARCCAAMAQAQEARR